MLHFWVIPVDLLVDWYKMYMYVIMLVEFLARLLSKNRNLMFSLLRHGPSFSLEVINYVQVLNASQAYIFVRKYCHYIRPAFKLRA